MDIQEFSDSFDTLLNSHAFLAPFGEQASKAEISLDEYEKSVFLTQAQDAILKSLFNGKKNPIGEGFDDSTEVQMDFSTLVTTKNLTKVEDSAQELPYDERGIIYYMPVRNASADPFDTTFDPTFHPVGKITPDVLFILNEKLVTEVSGSINTYIVIPMHYKEYDRLMTKPYGNPLKRQAWRLFQNNTRGFDIKSEIIPRFNLTEDEVIKYYRIRYVRRPYPIILLDLPDGLNIDGFTQATECELDPTLHYDILNKAVELAVRANLAKAGVRGAAGENTSN